MSPLNAQRLLQAWECARAEHPIRRALTLLDVAWPDIGEAHWRGLPIGTRDTWLIALHEALFGATLPAQVDCPACGEPLEPQLATTDLCTAPTPADGPAPLEDGGIALLWRLPTSDDLLAVLDTADAADRLLERCVREARRGDVVLTAAELPEPLIERLQQEMARLDPGADLRIGLACPDCGHSFERRFDIAAHLWTALDDWAERMLDEIHCLAGAYGWGEAEILALSAARRQQYIDRVLG